MENSSVIDVQVEDEAIETGIEKPDIDILVEHLEYALADTYCLLVQTQGVHWNVVGPAFYSVHNLTEEQYEDLSDAVDSIAERIRALGHISPSSFEEFAAKSILKNKPQNQSASVMLDELVDAHEKVALRLRKAVNAAEKVNDVFTADMLTARIGTHEQFAWMLRSLNA